MKEKLNQDEMSNFIGCFLTGTAAEITPVSQIDNYKFTVCELIKTKDLSESYINLVRKKSCCLTIFLSSSLIAVIIPFLK